jgi:hypothetical protein
LSERRRTKEKERIRRRERGKEAGERKTKSHTKQTPISWEAPKLDHSILKHSRHKRGSGALRFRRKEAAIRIAAVKLQRLKKKKRRGGRLQRLRKEEARKTRRKERGEKEKAKKRPQCL